ncbi:MAG: class B sortase [Oscillospiraceae bacterium]
MDIDKYKKQIIIVACLITAVIIALFVMLNNNKTLEVLEPKETTAQTTITTTTPITTQETTVTTVTTTSTTPVTTTEPQGYVASITKDKIMKYRNSTENCKGWIYVKDSAIDYPVMQSDDNEFYVTHDWTGKESGSGAIMLDYECTIGKTNNVLMYGHNMADGSMFHAIKSYKDDDWWKSHQYIEVADLEKVYIYQVFSVGVFYGLWDADFTYWLEPNKSLATEEDYNYYIDNVMSNQSTSIGIEPPTYPTKIISLQTCNSGNDDGMRCLAFAKLVDIQNLK